MSTIADQLADMTPQARALYLHLFCVEGGMPWWVAG